MIHLVVQHKVKDFAAWKKVFDDHGKFRKSHGELNHRVFRGIDNPNDITVIFAWENETKAKQFTTSSDLREKMDSAGVISQPAIHMLTESN